MKKTANNSNYIPGPNERSSYHHPPSNGQEKKCDSCRYRVSLNECSTFRCKDCGTYIICDYCYEDYVEKSGLHKKEGESMKDLNTTMKKIQCVYCWSRHTLTDICVKTLKSLGFPPQKGSTKILISTLSKDKVKKLTNLRVIQKTLVYVIGIAPEIATEEILKQPEYFGQYGDLQKVVVNTNNVYNATRGGPSYSAYLTFSQARESAIAILSVDQYILHDRMMRASFGTSKFCQFFLNGQKCTNKDCLYLHELRSDLEAYTKEDMQNNKFIFQEQQKIAIKLSKALEFTIEEFQAYNKQNNPNLQKDANFKPLLPSPDTIYYKDFHFLDEPLINRKSIPNNLMTLSNQKDENNQIERENSLTRISNKQEESQTQEIQDQIEEESKTEQQEEVKVKSYKKQPLIEEIQNIQSPKETTKKIIEMEVQQLQNTNFQTLQPPSNQNNTNKKSEASTLSKTPPHTENQLALQAAAAAYLLSPMFFKKKQESRFHFAHSVDPIKSCDWDEIEVPAKIQDLIERNIRTLSNSISNKSEHILINGGTIDLNELKERWLTKQEQFLLKNEKNIAPNLQSLESPRNRNIQEDSNPIVKYKNKKGEQTINQTEQTKQGIYNLKEHSVNIRVKYNKQSDKDISQQNCEETSNKDQQIQDEGKSSSSCSSSAANKKSYRNVKQQDNIKRRRQDEIRTEYRKVGEY